MISTVLGASASTFAAMAACRVWDRNAVNPAQFDQPYPFPDVVLIPQRAVLVTENLLVAVDRDEAIASLESRRGMVAIGKVDAGIDGAFFVEHPSEDTSWWKTGARLAGSAE